MMEWLLLAFVLFVLAVGAAAILIVGRPCRGPKPLPHAHGNVLCFIPHPCRCGGCGPVVVRQTIYHGDDDGDGEGE